MNIHAGNDADNCGTRADLKELHTQGTIYLSSLSPSHLPFSMLAPSLHALGTDARARVTRWLIQQPSADWKT